MTTISLASPTLADLLDESNWLEWRSRIEHLPTLKRTAMVTTDQTRAEFVEGCRLLRLDRFVRAGDGGTGPTPIQLAVADVIHAGRFLNGVMEPRRTTKTTSIIAVGLGRCAMREDYAAAFTMLTTGAKAAEWFRKNVSTQVERLYPDRRTSPITVNVGKGTEHLYFRGTGSWFNVYTPNGDGFRSGGFDFALADEGGEATVELSEDITLAVLPTMDTKPGAQFVVAGTGAKYRGGNILWETLTDVTAAGLWHGIPETTDPEALEDWNPTPERPRARMRELVELHHPGVGYTTPADAVERNYRKFPRDKFLLEYGGMFGLEGRSDRMIPAAWWERAGSSDPMPAPPATFAAFLKVHHDGSAATLAVAFEYSAPGDLVTAAEDLAGDAPTARRRRAIAVLHHQDGTMDLDREVLYYARRYGVRIVFDNHGHTAVVAGKLADAYPPPELHPTKPADVPLAVVTLMQGLEDGSVIHFHQPELDAAAERAIRASFGQYGSFRFGAPKDDPGLDMSPLEACAGALRFLDTGPAHTAPAEAMQW